MNLILASQSPRRKELLNEVLTELGLKPDFEIKPADIDETPLANETPITHVLRLARAKAEKCAQSESVVIAADTIVVLDDQILGKPRDQTDAHKMLTALSGRTHDVMTGVAILHTASETVTTLFWDCVISQVSFHKLTDKEIKSYIAGGEPMDKAGAYAIQGGAKGFVTKLNGSLSNVIGLPKEWVSHFLPNSSRA